MKAFEDLTHRGQVRRLRRLAQAALEQYGLGHAQFAFVVYSENVVFHVDAPQKSGHAGNRYALRIHRPELDGWLEWAAAHIQLYLEHAETRL